MQHLVQRNESDYHRHNVSQPDLLSNMNSFSLHSNTSSINIPLNNGQVTGYPSPPVSSSAPNMTPRSSRLPGQKVSEEWKKSSSSSGEGWKTSSTSGKKKEMESWKMSTKPRHAQLANIVDDDMRSRRQSAPVLNSPSAWPKPLPQEPCYPPPTMSIDQSTAYTTSAPFHITTPVQQSAAPFQPDFSHHHHYPAQQGYPPTIDHYPAPSQEHYPRHQQEHYPAMVNDYSPYNRNEYIPQDYPPPQHMHLVNYPPVQQQPYNEYPINNQPYNEYSPNMDYSIYQQPPIVEQEHLYHKPTTLSDPPVPTTSTSTPVAVTETKTNSKKKDSKPEKKIRQITVQSINVEHRVWIDVLPAETGLSLAEKIHIIATFRTRKIVSITTASGRKVPLDNRPVFGSWMDMESFEDGERWTVEWRENDRGVVDKFMSKFISAGGGKRTKDLIAKE